MRLRAARTADVVALVALERRCFRHDRLTARDFRRLVADPRAWLRVAVEDGTVLGYALARHTPRQTLARLDSLAVAPAARGRGLGRRLVAALERWARGSGCTRIRLEVRLTNRAARRLYAALGYAPRRRLPDHYGPGADGLSLERAFPARHRPAHNRRP